MAPPRDSQEASAPLPPSSGVARLWHTSIDPARAHEYERFARERSLPMFRSHAGLLGVLFGGTGADRVVITLWEDADCAASLERSEVYLETVKAIEQTGFLRPPQRVEYVPLHDWWLADARPASR